jgi:hypothetical protein
MSNCDTSCRIYVSCLVLSVEGYVQSKIPGRIHNAEIVPSTIKMEPRRGGIAIAAQKVPSHGAQNICAPDPNYLLCRFSAKWLRPTREGGHPRRKKFMASLSLAPAVLATGVAHCHHDATVLGHGSCSHHRPYRCFYSSTGMITMSEYLHPIASAFNCSNRMGKL